ncbi:MAG: cadmium-translocating P-type ATPase [Candidatus Omnitrophica bacterium]|nr:cadmium-translocating P-type ATPase [Candidatus Omnitrophota bacterium]MBU1047672.1 cadmium-translocating P-type ATPase [Candidatus Omnitrophota bacterium]MBU1631511.1 cadmium-translocating P-type ATPase [Candidatus Omnitrophota bacterium]MBU1767328.1 cadmium-translocating P-type ATPase [Candidatus Omnitrophota bacterium]MBU1888598.1 cadmium-translocating P-type ATPase [Candidatus Omnitrophota bacterium]
MQAELYHPVHFHEEESHLVRSLLITLTGGILIFNAFIATRLFPDSPLISELSALAGALLLGLPMIVKSSKGFFTGGLRLTELASIAVLACIALGDYKTAGVVAFILVLGELLEHRTALGAQEAIESLLKLTPPMAHIVRDGEEKDILVKELKSKDIIRIKPGENIPADAVIVQGDTSVNEASITGESFPVDKQKGDRIFEGTNNITGAILAEVEKIGEDTTLGKVKQLILEAEKTRIPIMSLIEKHVYWYIPVILMTAALILFFTRDASRSISSIIVGVPCALLLATPTAIIAVLSVAARKGVMIKEARKIEIAAEIDAVVFDKTGTLTTGELRVTSINPVREISPDKLIYYVATLEKHSLHPVARAIRELAVKANVKLTEPEEFKETGGRGVTGKVDGKKLIVGRESYLKENKIEISAQRKDSGSVLHIAMDGQYYGWIQVEDQMRIEAKETTEQLKKLGIKKLIMLTGDTKEVAQKIAQESGFEEVVAECLPETKLEIVEGLQRKGYHVVVIGDGINDAPALAAGDIGIAMGAMGSDVAINSASIALMSNDLRRVPFFISLSRLAHKIIYQNIALGGAFVLVGLALAGMGIVNPIVAALYHEVGSLVVILNSARIVKFESI